MKARKRNFRKNSSGQLLIVAALAIAILIASASIYVYELNVEQNGQSALQTASFIPVIKQCTRNAMISSLANISNGGARTVLATNLEGLAETLRSLRQQAIFQLTFNLHNDSDYEHGIKLLWGDEGFGASSAYASFTLNVQGVENVKLDYTLNMTTAILVEGFYTENGDEKNVTVACHVYNEEKPAQAKNISLFYELGGAWIPANSSNNVSTLDFGNGTYTISFSAIIPSETVHVSVHITDMRDIFVYANATCTKA
ncbi:MAG: hypothetical protein QXX51_03580 [Candidatus Bathyarchaeia archaeon]